MKSQVLVVSFASVLLALPAWTQQGNGNSTASPAMTTVQSTSDREPLTAPVPKDFWDGDDPNLVNLVTHPFATKAYVQRQTRPIRDRVNELDQLTSENSRSIRDVDARSQHGIQMASEKSALADQHATDALNRSQLAKTSAMEASARVAHAEQTLATLGQYKGGAQTEIRFRPGQTVLGKHAKDALDTLAAPLKAQKGYIVEIRGFVPGRGRLASANARKMSDSVRRYLVLKHKIPLYRISVLNMTAGRVGKNRRASGRVNISILQNSTMTIAQR